jgi:hypothetical protein
MAEAFTRTQDERRIEAHSVVLRPPEKVKPRATEFMRESAVTCLRTSL